MARIRSIKPETLSDAKAARLSDGAWRLWVSMWMLADDSGRLPGDPEWLNAQVFWAKPHEMRPLVDELSKVGFVTFYEANGEQLACVSNFNKHQKIDKPSPPKYPPPPDHSPNPRRILAESSATPRHGIGGEGIGEGEGVVAHARVIEHEPDTIRTPGERRALDVMRIWNAIENVAPWPNWFAVQVISDGIDAIRASTAKAPADEVWLMALWRVAQGMQSDGLHNVTQPKTLVRHLGLAMQVALGEVDLNAKPKAKQRGDLPRPKIRDAEDVIREIRGAGK